MNSYAPIALTFVLMLSWNAKARAQDDAAARRTTESQLRLVIEPRALYLAALDDSGATHAGVELTTALYVPLHNAISFVARGRFGIMTDVSAPLGERDDTSCTNGSWGFSPCFGDLDGRIPLGIELGVGWFERIVDGESYVLLGAELLLSGTANLSFYETVATSGGMGGAANLSADYILPCHLGIGAAVGGRIEGPIEGASFAAAHASLRLSFHL